MYAEYHKTGCYGSDTEKPVTELQVKLKQDNDFTIPTEWAGMQGSLSHSGSDPFQESISANNKWQ